MTHEFHSGDIHINQGKMPQIIIKFVKNIKWLWISVHYVKKRTQTDDVDELGAADNVHG